MIHFIIYEDGLIYKAKIEKTISKFKSYKYDISYNKYINNSKDIFIFIINVDSTKKIELIKKIVSSNKTNNIIICISKFEEMYFKIFKQKLYIMDFISKFDDHFEEKLKKVINTIIKHYKIEQNEIKRFDNNIYIPKQDIKHVIIFKDKTIISCANNKNQSYTHIINSNSKYLKNNLKELFEYDKIDNILYFNNNLGINLIKKDNYKKPYNNKIKTDVLKMYKNGISIEIIKNKYNISKSTIYNWIKENRVSEVINRYKKIEKIVKEENNNV